MSRIKDIKELQRHRLIYLRRTQALHVAFATSIGSAHRWVEDPKGFVTEMGAAPSSDKFWEKRFAEVSVIFLHPPRTGGSAVEDSVFVSPGEKYPGPQNLSAEEWRKRLGSTFDKAFRFAAVRNPFTRLVSAYEEPEVRQWAGEGGFRSCVEKLAQHPEDVPLALRSQNSFLRLEDGTLVTETFIRQESLQSDLRRLVEQGAVELRKPIPPKNLTSCYMAANLEQWYDSSYLVGLVAEIYEEDFDILGYDKGALPVAETPSE